MVLSFNYVLYKFTYKMEFGAPPFAALEMSDPPRMFKKKVYPWIIVLERKTSVNLNLSSLSKVI